ncbi:MAG: protein translocase subunit SecD [Candidatus Omnitrophica bacterium]|nr:protein translocase subunit SecD [Candidatus Omnitrophota bacterium]
MRNLFWKLLITAAIVGFSLASFYPLSEKINLGLDLRGGMHLILRVDTSAIDEDAQEGAVDRALEIIRNRIDQFGVKEPILQKQGTNKILIQLPGITDRDRAVNLIGQTAILEFKLVSSEPDLVRRALSGNVPSGYQLKYLEEEPLLVSTEAVLTGAYLISAEVHFDQSRFNQPIVSIKFNAEGARKFARVTQDNVGSRLAIILDGNVKSAPVIRERIPSGEAVISGRFGVQEAKDLSIVLKAGSLPAPLIIEEERTVGPLLGKDSVDKGIKAIAIGGSAVAVFMVLYYLLAGLIALCALVLNIVIILGALGYFGATLTLPGIAGIVLTIGMAVDANVLIYERIREELNLGKNLAASIQAGYQKAFLAIFDANLTTLIAAVILFQFGTGPIRGFATTLTIGILASMFTALFVTRFIFDFLTSRGLTKMPMLLIFPKLPKFNFMSKRRAAYIISAAAILFGAYSFWQKGEKNLGIDFTGGVFQEFEFQRAVSTNDIRSSLKAINLGDSMIQQVKNTNRFIIRTYSGATADIIGRLKSDFGEDNIVLLRNESVGAIVGKDLKKKAVYALVFSLIAMCLYIAIRFELKFAIAAMVALIHDILICIGAMSLTGREFSLPVIAAILTVVGYSINDTIVIFDRIRENMRIDKKKNFSELVNYSIDQTLSRTILTSLTTLLTVISLFMFGGEVINTFSFVLLVGIIVGTYSSIFIASPVVVDWIRGKR